MSLQLIQQYYNKRERITQYSGSRKENQIRAAFESLLEQFALNRNLELIPNLEYKTKSDSTVIPDGTLKDALRQDWGYWESKDEYDSLEDEINSKLAKGYPTTNIIFEDGITAVLFQKGEKVGQIKISNPNDFLNLLTTFFNYEPREVETFRTAITKFKIDLPELLSKLRQLIEDQAQVNDSFVNARDNFLSLCQKSINPHVVLADIREMIIQHILTEDIFITVFNDAQFHQENNISSELAKVVQTFFKGEIRRNILGLIEPYYRVIKAAASNIQNHHEKQKFLKALYENFYQSYNPAAADRLGIIYTPEEIVRFMVDTTDYLIFQKFNRLLSDENVEIIDPACGTGTFITEIIEHLPKNQLRYKYENEIHCNEVAILPYYVANLNIEYTYAQKMGHYAEYKNICFVDTLDNLGFSFGGKQYHLFDISTENLERIKRQNKRTISVIIGNPPYNANQRNENENNKNREYPGVDKRIKDTYVSYSTAQKTKVYDMYSRFLRWSSDRLSKNGIIAFVSNNSFINDGSFDGFRKVVADEFNEIYIIDMKGDARTSGEERRRQGGNIFSDKIRVGVAVYFLLRKEGMEGCKIFYNCIDDYTKAEAKKSYLRDNKFQDLNFEHIVPDNKNTWIKQNVSNWDALLPIGTSGTKHTNINQAENAIFKFFSLGISTNRDEWVISHDVASLERKVRFLIRNFNRQVDILPVDIKEDDLDDMLDYSIKWSDVLKKRLLQRKKFKFDKNLIKKMSYRPFIKMFYYAEKGLSDRLTENHYSLFGKDLSSDNLVITLSGTSATKPFAALAVKNIFSLDFLEKTQSFPLYRYDQKGNRVDNITEWSVTQFREKYSDLSIDKMAIFYYVYAILHSKSYRSIYEINLIKELPRIPFLTEFWEWSDLGRRLMVLHTDYESVALYPLKRIDKRAKDNNQRKILVKLKIDKQLNKIEIDSNTILEKISPISWEYKLGNRAALEWILEYHKETKPRDQTILNNFNSYKFVDYKKETIELLQRICTVSVETMKIIEKMGEINE